MKQFSLILFCFSGICSMSIAQNGPQYSMQMLNRYQFNPAFAGMDASLSINAAYRSQWENIPGNPIQQNLNAHMPFYFLNGALGVELTNESIGAEKNISFAVSYNYVYETDFGLFSFGVRPGILQKSLDGTILRALDGDYENSTIDHKDPNLPNSLVNGIRPFLDAGVYFSGDYFEVGFALNKYVLGNVVLDGQVRFDAKPHLNGFFEYFIESFEYFDIYPTLFMKTDFKETQIEMAIRTVYDDYLTVGAGFRGFSKNTTDAIIIFGGLQLSPKLNLGYGFDWTLSPLKTVTSGTHEIVLRYNLNKIIGTGLPPRVIYNPRLLDN